MVEIARTIKPKDHLFNRRVSEKFEIERVFWERRGVDWGIVTEVEINKIISHNLSFVFGYYDLSNIDSFTNINDELIRDLVNEFIRRIIDNQKSMREICHTFDMDMHLESGSGISILKHIICHKYITIDLAQKFDLNKNIEIIKICEDFFKEEGIV